MTLLLGGYEAQNATGDGHAREGADRAESYGSVQPAAMAYELAEEATRRSIEAVRQDAGHRRSNEGNGGFAAGNGGNRCRTC